MTTTSNDQNKAAIAIAEQFNIDAADISGAYKNKPESLTAHFNAMSKAKADRGWYVGWTIFWGLVFAPIAAYPAWKLGEKYLALHNINKSVRSEVEHYKTAPPANPAP